MDSLRGAALLGMVVYHGAWDLHAFGLIATDPSGDAGWRVLGGGVAALFLLLSGFSLSLALRQGTPSHRFWLRLGRIAASAALITVATLWAVPQAPIWFGILHCIVLTNILALAFRSAPTLWLPIAAVAAFAAPFGLRGVLGPGWAWTGLAAAEPATLDFRPVLPWLAPVLIGMALGRTSGAEPRWLRPGKPQGRRPLAWAGRHSLLVYLLHQPLMLGVLIGLFGAVPRDDVTVATLRQTDQAGAFLRHCRDSCVAHGGELELCASTCHCVLTSALSRTTTAPSRWQGFATTVPRSLDAAAALCQRPYPTQGSGDRSAR